MTPDSSFIRRIITGLPACPGLLACLGLLVCYGSVTIAAPALERIEPPGGKQGAEVEIRITGTELDEPQELFFEADRISVAALTGENNVVTATLRIPADCPPGPQRLRLRTAEGLSDLRMFHVHLSDQLEEQEPNDAPESAQPIAAGQAVWGTLRNEDVDTFRIHLPAGGRISAVVEAVRLDQQMLDPHLELLDAEGFVVAACDDHPLLAQDAAIAVTVEREGDYFLRVRETAYGGGNGVYLLHVGNFPIPHVAGPPGGPPGATLDVEWIGDPAGPFRQQVILPAAELDGLARVRPVRGGGEQPSPLAVPFRVTAAPIATVAEPSNEPAAAAQATAPTAIVGRIDASDDIDWIRVEAPKGSTWRVSGWGRRLGSPVDLVLNAHRDNDKREKITGNDDADGPDSVVQVTVPEEAAFLLRVNDFQHRGGPDFIYWIDVEQVLPQVTVSVPPAQTKTQQRLVVAVPRGNRMALFFNATRINCGDPVQLDFADLPVGVTASSALLGEPAPGGLVVFEAAPDAPAGTALATVRVMSGAGDAAKQIGGLRQETDTIYGEPNRTTYRTALGDRLAVAVVEEAPVSIELVPPAVPIVRRGVLELKVKVHRAEDFDGKVRLELPFKPPGIGASTVDVKEGETEILFPINAAADAPVREWQIAVAASLIPAAEKKSDSKNSDTKKPDTKKERQQSRRAGRGSWIASRPVTLTVSEPLVELAAEKAMVEQGHETKLTFKATRPAAFTGTAKATLIGLPTNTQAPALELKAGDESLEFAVTVAADAPVGRHENIFCRIEVPVGTASVVHQTPATSLRIDKPLPPLAAKESGS